MSALRRSLRDLTRKKLRTIGVIIVIGLSLGVYLALTSVANAVADEVSYLEASVQDTVSITQNGSGGIFSQGAVNATIIPAVEQTPDVTAVQPLIVDRYSPTTGSIGCAARRGGAGCVLLEAENSSSPLVIYGGGSPTIVSGSLLGPSDGGALDADIGTELSTRLGLGVGGTLTVNGTAFTILGTFTTGTTFGDLSVLLPYQAALTATGAKGPTVLYVTVNSPGNVEIVVNDLKGEAWDSTGGYDVTALINSEVPQIQAASNAVGSLSTFASSVALLVGTLIIVFVMVVATRERIREIGLMKALGFHNRKIIVQSISESMVLAALGFVVSLAILELIGPSLANLLSGSTGRGGGTGVAQLLSASFTVAPSLVVVSETLGIVILMGAAGALYPIVRALRLKPAEALRYE